MRIFIISVEWMKERVGFQFGLQLRERATFQKSDNSVQIHSTRTTNRHENLNRPKNPIKNGIGTKIITLFIEILFISFKTENIKSVNSVFFDLYAINHYYGNQNQQFGPCAW